MKKITVFAMTKKGKAVIMAIHSKYPHMISAVIASRDSGVKEDYYDEIRDFCTRHAIVFYDRHESYSVATDYSLAVSWRWIIDTSRSRLIVFHDSLLPRYRGFNPLVTALINGDKKIGVTALFGTESYDRGDIIAQSEKDIEYPITIAQAIDEIQESYASLGLGIADMIYRDAIFRSSPQCEESASYSLWRDEEDYFIDWTASATTIKRIIDAVGFPYKGAASVLEGKVVRLLESEVVGDVKIENRKPGKVIFIHDSKPIVVCGQGLLRIDDIRDEHGESVLPLRGFRMRFKGFSKHVTTADAEKQRW